MCARREARSGCEHLLKHSKNTRHGRGRQAAEAASQTLLVDGANLIQDDEARPTAEPAGDAEGIGMASGS